eukprot:scaffold24022_cov168-Amphora_coffeaeformis.AAC.12
MPRKRKTPGKQARRKTIREHSQGQGNFHEERGKATTTKKVVVKVKYTGGNKLKGKAPVRAVEIKVGTVKTPTTTTLRVSGQVQIFQTCPDLLDDLTVRDMMKRVGESVNMIQVNEEAVALVHSLRPTKHLQHKSANRFAPFPVFHDDLAPIA